MVNVADLPRQRRTTSRRRGSSRSSTCPCSPGRSGGARSGSTIANTSADGRAPRSTPSARPRGTLGAAIHRQQTERSLRETEELYRTLVEQIPAVVYVNVIGEDYVPLYTSPGIEQMLGVTPDEFMTRRMWFELVHPDDRERVNAEDERTERTLEPFSIEYRMYRPDTRVVWVLDQAQVVRDENGEPRFWSGVMFDITTLKQAEEDLGSRIGHRARGPPPASVRSMS